MSEKNQPDLNNFPPPSAPAPQPVEPNAPVPAAPPMFQGPAKKKSSFSQGFGWGAGIAAGVGTVFMVLSVISSIMMVMALVGVAAASGGSTVATTATPIWGSGGSGKLRAVSVNGVILAEASQGSVFSSGTYGYEVASEIDGITKEEASGLIVLVNSPGGSIGGSRAISDAIVRYKERTGHKVFVHINGVSASGGVYSMVAADEIVADHGSLVGSIGVIMGPFMKYNGVTATTGTLFESGVTTTGGVTAETLTAGKYKDFGNAWRAMSDEERQHYKTGLDNEYKNFVSHVSTHRNISEDTIVNTMGALIFDNARAKELGLIDSTMGREEFYRHAATEAGLNPDDTEVLAIQEPTGLEALFGATRALGHAPAAQQGAGISPVLSTAICGGREPLVFAGDLSAACG